MRGENIECGLGILAFPACSLITPGCLNHGLNGLMEYADASWHW